MTTLVTGAAGFLGSHVTRQLVARGEEVRVLMRASSSNRAISDLPLEYVTGDLRDASSLERAMRGVQRVFHVAADYRLWAERSARHLRFERGRNEKFTGGGESCGRVATDLHQHSGDDCGGPAGIAE